MTREVEPPRVLGSALQRGRRDAAAPRRSSLYLLDAESGALRREAQWAAGGSADRDVAAARRADSRASAFETRAARRVPRARRPIRASTPPSTRPRAASSRRSWCCRCASAAARSACAAPSRRIRALASPRTAEVLGAALSAAVRNVLLYRSLVDSIEEVARARQEPPAAQRRSESMQALIDKAKVLIEALPYMRRFFDKTIVIKYGGAAQKDVALRASFAVDVVLLKHIGVRPVIVHGGGPQIGATLERLGKQSTFVDGLRVTDDETMDVVEMVLGGKVNHEIVELVQQAGGRAIGLTGSDGGMIRVKRRTKDGRDIGRVGEVVGGRSASAIAAVADAGFVPVIAPIGVGDDGRTYNVNADEAAGAIAQALRAEKLILLTDVRGRARRRGPADPAAHPRARAR